MGRRIKPAGKGFVKVDNNLLNLNEYKAISRNPLNYNEDPDQRIFYSIGFTPNQPTPKDIENGVDGTWFISYHDEKDKKDFEADFKTLVNAQKDGWVKNAIIALIITILGGLIVVWLS